MAFCGSLSGNSIMKTSTLSSLALIAFILPLSLPLFAQPWIQPIVGYTTGKFKINSSSYGTDGIYYGIQGGVYWRGYKLGATYQTGATEIDTLPKSDVRNNQLGVYVGKTILPDLNVFGEYFPSSSMSFNNSNVKWKSNTGYRIGFNYSGIPLFTLGLKYNSITYTETNGNIVSGNLRSDPKIDAYEFVVGMRF